MADKNLARRRSVSAAAFCGLLAGLAQGEQPDPATAAPTIIVKALVADGTGAPLKKVNVRISGERIGQVGSIKPGKGEHVIDATGLVLAPGFIDIHNHSDGDANGAAVRPAFFERHNYSDGGLTKDPLAETQI